MFKNPTSLSVPLCCRVQKAQNALELKSKRSKSSSHSDEAPALLWRAENFHPYMSYRAHDPTSSPSTSPAYLLSPEFLLHTVAAYKTLLRRMEERNVTFEGAQSAPNGFVGVALLANICQRVDVYGFDTMSRLRALPAQYYSREKVSNDAVHAGDAELGSLRVLDAFGAIRLCTVDRLEECIYEDEREGLGTGTGGWSKVI
eukprot:jgi/Chlat1/5658/Chrsp37S09010